MSKIQIVAAVIFTTLGLGSAYAASQHSGHDMSSMGNTQMAQMAGHDMSKMSASQDMSDGLVKKVDVTGGRVTLQHSALKNLDMPAMTMAFKLKDPAWASDLKVGDKIRFVAENPSNTLTVVQYEKVK